MAEKGTARLERLKRREEARLIREDHALHLFASGLTYEEITLDLAEKFGTSRTSVSNTRLMIDRAFARHTVRPEDIETARTRLRVLLEEMLRVWTPLALGRGLDADLNPRMPSDKAAEVVFKAADRYAQVTGAIKPPDKQTNINVNVLVPPDAESKRALVAQELRRERDKLVVIEGELANAGTSLDAHRGTDGRQQLLPPPVPTRGELE